MYIYTYYIYIYIWCFFIRSPVHMKMGPPIGWSYWRLFSIWMGDGFFFMSVFCISVGFCGWPASLWIIWICLKIGYSKSPMISNNSSWFIMIHHHFETHPIVFHMFSCTFDHFAHEKMGADALQRCRQRWRASDVRNSSFIRSDICRRTLGET